MAKRKIKDIYKGYFQKSRVFLYPALGHKKGIAMLPQETYMSWGDKIHISENKLICLYDLRDDDDFIAFEDRFLLGNPLFEDYKEVGNNKAIYIFDLDAYCEDFVHIANAKYSQLSQGLKNMIRDSYGGSTAEFAYIHSYLYPEEYYDTYAEILCVDPADVPDMTKLISEVGELCTKPNLSKERLEISVKSLKL